MLTWRRTGWTLAALAIAGAALLLWPPHDNPALPDTTGTTSAAPPQIIIHGLTRLTTTDQGQWLSTVRAERANYFEAADRLHLLHPDIEGEDRDPYHITASTAVLRDSNHWTLENNVVLTNNPNDSAPVMIHTDFLEYDTLTDIVQTPQAVRIEQPGRMLTTAVGMVFELDTQEYELHDQVRSHYQPAGN